MPRTGGSQSASRPLLRLWLALLLPCAYSAEAEGSGGRTGGGRKHLRVAVIGGGIAGSATALELLRYDHVDVTIFEQADRIGHNQSASGIIAALTIFNSQEQYWHNAPDDPEQLLETFRQLTTFFMIRRINFRMVEFAHRMALNMVSGDVRTSKDYKRRFNRASRLRLEEQLDRFPELCAAIQGPYCCREGSRAREWMDKTRGEAHNESCSIKRGLFHTWLTRTGWRGADQPEQARAGGWDLAEPGNDPAGHLRDAERWLREDDIQGVLWNSADEGFVRVEALYPILTEIFRKSGRAHLALRCLVGSLKQSSSGIEVVAPACPEAGVYDRVVVAGGANSVNILEGQDEVILSDLFPIKGFAVATMAPLLRKEQLGMGMHVEDLSHYVRPTSTGGVAYGFGKEIDTWDDQLLAPKYESWEDRGPAATGLGREVLNQTDVARLSGIRPLSAWNDFPLLKHYQGRWSGLVLNTGYGFYGYTLSWKSAQLAASLAATGEVSDPDFAAAVELYSGCGAMPCWAWRWYLFVGIFAWSLATWALVGCCCAGCCGACCMRRARSRTRADGGFQPLQGDSKVSPTALAGGEPLQGA